MVDSLVADTFVDDLKGVDSYAESTAIVARDSWYGAAGGTLGETIVGVAVSPQPAKTAKIPMARAVPRIPLYLYERNFKRIAL